MVLASVYFPSLCLKCLLASCKLHQVFIYHIYIKCSAVKYQEKSSLHVPEGANNQLVHIHVLHMVNVAVLALIIRNMLN